MDLPRFRVAFILTIEAIESAVGELVLFVAAPDHSHNRLLVPSNPNDN